MAPHTASARLSRTALGALVTAGVLLLSGCSLWQEAELKTSTADATVAEAVTAVELTGVRRGSVEVTAGAGPGVTVHRVAHYRGDTAPTPGQRVSGGVLSFSDGCRSGEACWIDYRLEVPASAKVRVAGSSGDITVTGVAAAELDSSSGDVRAERIAGPLKVRTSSGEIRATALAGPEADLASSSGDTTAEFAKAPDSLSATTGSGNVTLKVPRSAYRLSATTASGDRDITLPVTADGPSRITVRTSSGDIRVSAA
ncbi:DUF4097 family beta strand repeat-containing protein [Streptomyces sp. NBC_00091]|uniref:DUF4097 family beta strand repeat-containing protein n=1 Tax=Streptomyces sp. NBC_00091 TaxID=2975648 RepID=UPI002251AB49|nr:DUF4097 family beta strand repeat-containing protein [Streptomyces sp. NBC_00091]MCX5375899.1 DUF4097 domain-containing protein [Streptomyces sp. NBC_00091]